jgi:hypothetical protein
MAPPVSNRRTLAATAENKIRLFNFRSVSEYTKNADESAIRDVLDWDNAKFISAMTTRIAPQALGARLVSRQKRQHPVKTITADINPSVFGFLSGITPCIIYGNIPGIGVNARDGIVAASTR